MTSNISWNPHRNKFCQLLANVDRYVTWNRWFLCQHVSDMVWSKNTNMSLTCWSVESCCPSIFCHHYLLLYFFITNAATVTKNRSYVDRLHWHHLSEMVMLKGNVVTKYETSINGEVKQLISYIDHSCSHQPPTLILDFLQKLTKVFAICINILMLLSLCQIYK